MTRIEPCPSCHNSNVHIAEWYLESGDVSYYCQCDDCGFSDKDDRELESPELAIDHWNTRVVTGCCMGDADPSETEFDLLSDDRKTTWKRRKANYGEDYYDSASVVGPIKWTRE